MLSSVVQDDEMTQGVGAAEERSDEADPTPDAARSIANRASEPGTERDRRRPSGSNPYSRQSRPSTRNTSSHLRVRGDTISQHIHIGIDVSKAHLDVATSQSSNIQNLSNDQAGFHRLLKLLPSPENCQIVFESTGNYHFELLVFLTEREYRVAVLSPARVRAFALALNILAKTDALDALVLVQFSKRVEELHFTPLPSEKHQKIHALVTRRRQLVELLTQEKNHREATRHPAMKDDINQVIALLKLRLKELDKQISQLVDSDDHWQHLAEIITSVPGVGPGTAATLIAELPELGQLNRGEIASLVGVAPINRDSGKSSKTKTIRGGRKTVRNALYMAAFNAIRCNPVLNKFWHRLKHAGKPYRVCLIACMHKLLCILNVMVKNNTPWKLANND